MRPALAAGASRVNIQGVKANSLRTGIFAKSLFHARWPEKFLSRLKLVTAVPCSGQTANFSCANSETAARQQGIRSRGNRDVEPTPKATSKTGAAADGALGIDRCERSLTREPSPCDFAHRWCQDGRADAVSYPGTRNRGLTGRSDSRHRQANWIPRLARASAPAPLSASPAFSRGAFSRPDIL